jgi:hypothetical protein
MTAVNGSSATGVAIKRRQRQEQLSYELEDKTSVDGGSEGS